MVVDYYSRYVEIAGLFSTTSSDVINDLKSIFAHHGIPESVTSDNGPQYSSDPFQVFATKYGFVHRTCSPRFLQGNEEAE